MRKNKNAPRVHQAQFSKEIVGKQKRRAVREARFFKEIVLKCHKTHRVRHDFYFVCNNFSSSTVLSFHTMQCPGVFFFTPAEPISSVQQIFASTRARRTWVFAFCIQAVYARRRSCFALGIPVSVSSRLMLSFARRWARRWCTSCCSCTGICPR